MRREGERRRPPGRRASLSAEAPAILGRSREQGEPRRPCASARLVTPDLGVSDPRVSRRTGAAGLSGPEGPSTLRRTATSSTGSNYTYWIDLLSGEFGHPYVGGNLEGALYRDGI